MLYRILINYLNPKYYNIPVYIQNMFKHYCKVRVGAEWDGRYTHPPYYVSFSSINSDSSMFNGLRPFI